MVDMMSYGAHRPIASQPYTMPEKWKGPVQKELDELLDQGIMIPSVSPWASPVVPIQKPDGTARLCIDYMLLCRLILTIICLYRKW